MITMMMIMVAVMLLVIIYASWFLLCAGAVKYTKNRGFLIIETTLQGRIFPPNYEWGS